MLKSVHNDLMHLLNMMESIGKIGIYSSECNAYAERWVLSIKSECISGLIFFGEQSLLKALREYTIHYHEERNHQGKGNQLLFPDKKLDSNNQDGGIECLSRLSGVLNYYYRSAA